VMVADAASPGAARMVAQASVAPKTRGLATSAARRTEDVGRATDHLGAAGHACTAVGPAYIAVAGSAA
jgi:hypothetical protein